jgi:helix-turn-helix, Psq domain
MSLRQVARRFGISTTTIHRHKHAHLPSTLVRLPPATIIPGSNGSAPATSEDVLASLQRLHDVCREALEAALANGNMLQVALASRELRGALEVIGKHIDRLEMRRGAAVVDIARSADWLELRTGMVEVLDQFPEARRAMVLHLRRLNPRSMEELDD